jgi:hypothetical protein
MTDWKAPLSLRVPQELRAAIEDAFYAKEKSPDLKSYTAFAAQLLEFVWAQYQIAGSLERLHSSNIIEKLRESLVTTDAAVVHRPSATGKEANRALTAARDINARRAERSSKGKTGTNQ